MSQPVENFYKSLFQPSWCDICWGAKFQMFPRITVLQLHWCMWNGGRNLRSITGRWEKAGRGSDYRRWCALSGVHLDAQKQCTGLLRAKVNFLLKKLHAWGVTTHHDQPSWEFMIRSPCEVTYMEPLFSSTVEWFIHLRKSLAGS